MNLSLWASLLYVILCTIAQLQVYGQSPWFTDTCEMEVTDDPLEIDEEIVRDSPAVSEQEAFTAVLSRLSASGKIVFNVVRTNIGLSYNNDTGRFQAKSTGIYAFYWTGVASSPMTQIDLLVNDVVVGSITGDPIPSQGFLVEEASTAATVQLQKGDRVCISSNEPLQKDSLFSGFRLRDVEDSSVFYAVSNEKSVSESAPASFENVRINSKNDFGSEKFIASSSGIYVFSASASTFDSSVVLDVYKDNQEQTTSPAGRESFLNRVSSASNTLILELNNGSNVYTLIYRIRTGTITVGNQTVFSGFKQFSIDDLASVAITVKATGQFDCVTPCSAFNTNPAVLLDRNQNFNPATGEFTAPEDCYYVISVVLFSRHQPLSYNIEIDGQVVYRGSNSGPGSRWYNISTRVVIEHIRSGGTVKIVYTGRLTDQSNFSVWKL